MMIFQYTCTVIPGDGQQDALVCTVDGVRFQPCEFPLSKVLQEFSSREFKYVCIYSKSIEWSTYNVYNISSGMFY